MMASKGTDGSHKPDEGDCGGQVKDASCKGCGADNIKGSNIKSGGK